MSQRESRKPASRAAASRWRSRALVVVMLLAVVGGGVWWLWSPEEASGGTPRLVLDRETIDLGPIALGTTVRAVFTLTNAGDGPLRIANVPRVEVVEGC